MKNKPDKRFLLTVTGLFIISGAMIISHFYNLPDAMSGVLLGIGIGLTALPLILKKFRPVN